MAGSAFFVFSLTVLYHCYRVLSKTSVGKMLKAKANRSVTNNDANDSNVIPPRVNEPTVTYVAINDLREPLLND